jgi:hypothetical protein
MFVELAKLTEEAAKGFLAGMVFSLIIFNTAATCVSLR